MINSIRSEIKAQIENLSLEDRKRLVNLWASNESYDNYIFENIDELLELHYSYIKFTPSDLKDFLSNMQGINPWSTDPIWMDVYGNYNQGTLSEALDDNEDIDVLVDFCINEPYEVEGLIEIPEEEEEEEDE